MLKGITRCPACQRQQSILNYVFEPHMYHLHVLAKITRQPPIFVQAATTSKYAEGATVEVYNINKDRWTPATVVRELKPEAPDYHGAARTLYNVLCTGTSTPMEVDEAFLRSLGPVIGGTTIVPTYVFPSVVSLWQAAGRDPDDLFQVDYTDVNGGSKKASDIGEYAKATASGDNSDSGTWKLQIGNLALQWLEQMHGLFLSTPEVDGFLHENGMVGVIRPSIVNTFNEADVYDIFHSTQLQYLNTTNTPAEEETMRVPLGSADRQIVRQHLRWDFIKLVDCFEAKPQCRFSYNMRHIISNTHKRFVTGRYCATQLDKIYTWTLWANITSDVQCGVQGADNTVYSGSFEPIHQNGAKTKYRIEVVLDFNAGTLTVNNTPLKIDPTNRPYRLSCSTSDDRTSICILSLDIKDANAD
jgi:Zn ribbon nucleic-acid-binding protein